VNGRAAIRCRRGVSLVEEICAVCILAIGVFAIFALIGFSRVSVSSDSVKDAAAAQAQQLADNLVAQLSQQEQVPAAVDYNPSVGIHEVDIGGIQAANVGQPSSLGAAGFKRQFCITTAVNHTDRKIDGYDIVCRVYYADGGYVQFHAYASARGNTN
jgi:Tfp pilus assembly protein PilV